MADNTKESTILESILLDSDFSSKVFINLERHYFQDPNNTIIFDFMKEYFDKHSKTPSIRTIKIMVEESSELSEDQYSDVFEHINCFENTAHPDLAWLEKEAETWCKDRALHDVAGKLIQVLGKDPNIKLTETELPALLSAALGISFDTNLGVDLIRDAEDIFKFMTEPENKIEFDLKTLNDHTNGGITRKTLNIVLAGTHVGKTLVMSHLAAGYISKGYNVLYVSLEEEEKRLAQRILANAMDVNISDLPLLSQAQYMKNIAKIKNKVSGRLIYKQFPAAAIHVGHLRNFLKELEMKEEFSPDVVFIDYLALMRSMRVSNDNSYAVVKAVAEEVRGLGMEFNYATWSGAQTNRAGAQSSDPDMADTADSFGLPQTADFFLAAISTDELKKMGQYKVKQLKNRYTGSSASFSIGVDINKQRLYDLDSHEDLLVEGPSKTSAGIKTKEQSFEDFTI